MFNSSGFMDHEEEIWCRELYARGKKTGEKYEWGQINSGLVGLVGILIAQNWQINHHGQFKVDNDINTTFQLISLSIYSSSSKLEKEENTW